MTEAIDPRLVQVPGTDYAVIRGDSALGAWALRNGDIRGEPNFPHLECVKALRPGDLFLDIGAFCGNSSIYALDRGCEVIAIEAYEDAFAALQINCPDAKCIHACVGDGSLLRPTGRNVENGNNRGCSMVEIGGAIPSLRIDELNLHRIDLCKIDTEGAEVRVLNGARETIRRCRPPILIECYDRALAMHGFTRNDLLNWLWGESYAISVAIGSANDGRVDFLCTPAPKSLML